MKPSKMTPKQLKEARNALVKRLNEAGVLKPTRVTGLTDEGCTLEGGTFPATYKHTMFKGDLSVWGRGSRYSGGSMTIDELAYAERVVQDFFFELHEEDFLVEPNVKEFEVSSNELVD